MSADADRSSLHEVVQRLDALENRVAILEGTVVGGGGFQCAFCGTIRPTDWFLYEAFNPETKKTVKPLCGSCVQSQVVGGLPWKYHGPFDQPALTDPSSATGAGRKGGS